MLSRSMVEIGSKTRCGRSTVRIGNSTIERESDFGGARGRGLLQRLWSGHRLFGLQDMSVASFQGV